MKHKLDNPYTVTLVLLCFVNIIIRIPFFTNIPTNDSNVYFDGVLAVLQNHLNPFVNFVSYKPPFLYELVASMFLLFGPSIIIGNLIAAVCSSLTLLYTYLLGSLLFSKKTGFFAALCLFVFPIFTAQSFQFTDAIFITPLVLATVYYYYRSNTLGYLIFGICAVLTRETGIFVPIFFGCFELAREVFKHKNISKIQLRRTIIYLLPLFPFILWMYINKRTFGWYLDPVNIQFFDFNQPLWIKIITVIQRMVLHTGIAATIPIFMISIIKLCTKKITLSAMQKHMILTAGVLGSVNIVFYSIGPFHPRYMLFLYPYVWIITIGMACMTWKKPLSDIIIAVLGSIFIAYQGILYYFLPMQYWGETDLSIFHIQSLYTKAIHTTKQRFNDPILIVGPRIYEWRDPYLGYRNSHANYIYSWRVDLPENQAYQHFINYRWQHIDSAILFLLQSDDAQLPNPLQNRSTVVDTIYDDSGNRNNFLTVYQIME